MNAIQSRSTTTANANRSPLADALADNIARSLREGWKLRSCFKIPQLARYGVINRFEMLILLPCKLRFLTDLCLVSHSPEGF